METLFTDHHLFIEQNLFIKQAQQLVIIFIFNLEGIIPETPNKSKPSTSHVKGNVSHISESQIGLFSLT